MSDIEKPDKIPIGEVGIDEEFHGNFPTDAFVFDKISETNPKLRVVNPWCFSSPKHVLEKSANYTVLDSDGSCCIHVTTGAGTITITLPTVADNRGVEIEIVKVDSGAGKVVIDSEGSEVIYNQYTSFLTIELWLQFSFLKVISDNTQWIKTNSPYLHMLKEADRTSGSFDINVNPTTVPSWTLANLSALVPTGTLGLYGFYRIRNTDEEGVLLLRSAESVVTDEFAAITFVGKGGVVDRNGSPIIIRAKNGQFDYAEQSATTEIAIFSFQLWGWLL